MDLRRNEIATGALVLVTAAVVTGVVLALSAPGILHPHRYYVFFDNAGGMKPGTEVLLAGRHAGEVVDLKSPVPLARRPAGHEDVEVLVELRLSREARIYRSVVVRLQPVGLLGQQVIDFVSGDEASGLAPSGTSFVGERVPGLTDVSEEATRTLEELRQTLGNLTEMTARDGDLRQTAVNARQFTDTIKRQPWRLIWKSTKEYPDEEPSRGASRPTKERRSSR